MTSKGKEKLTIVIINLTIIIMVAGLCVYLVPGEIIFKKDFIAKIEEYSTPENFKKPFKDFSTIRFDSGRERDLAELPEAAEYKRMGEFNQDAPYFDPSSSTSIFKKLSNHIITFVAINFIYFFAIIIAAIYGGIIGSVITALTASGLVYYFYSIRELNILTTQLKACYIFTYSAVTGVEPKLLADNYYNLHSVISTILTFDCQLKIGLFLVTAVMASVLFDKKTGHYIRNLEEKISEAMRLQAENNKFQTVITDIKKLDEKNRTYSARLTSLQTLTRVVGKSLNYNETLKEILKVTQQIASADKCSIWIFDENSNNLILKECIGWKDEEKENYNTSSAEDVGIVGEALRNGRIMVETEHRGFSDNAEGAMMSSKACAPLKRGEKKIGIINIEKFQEDGKADQEELRMLELISTLAAMSIDNSNLFKQTETLANTDGLTKLYTRRYMEGFLEKELEKSIRYNHPLSFLISDIDHFKNFNDTYGHQIGDFVLEETARVLKNAVRNVDLAARYGGEEFVAVLPETDYKGAFTFAERYRKMVEGKEYVDQKSGQKLRVTISIGVASYPLHSKERSELIKKADAALYMAKEDGRNRTKIAPITKEQLAAMQQQKK